MGVGVVDDWEGVMEGEVVVVDEAAGRGDGGGGERWGGGCGFGGGGSRCDGGCGGACRAGGGERGGAGGRRGLCGREVVVVVVEGLGGPESGSASASRLSLGLSLECSPKTVVKGKVRGCSGVSRGLRSGRCRGWCWWGCLVVPLVWLLPPLAGASSCPTLRTSISRDLSLPRSSVRHSATVSFPIPCQPLM